MSIGGSVDAARDAKGCVRGAAVRITRLAALRNTLLDNDVDRVQSDIASVVLTAGHRHLARPRNITAVVRRRRFSCQYDVVRRFLRYVGHDIEVGFRCSAH